MRGTNGRRPAADQPPGTPDVAPRFTRAVKTERARLEGKRAQLLQKREAAQAEVARIDRAVEATDELLELLTTLLVAVNGSDPGDAAGDDCGAEAESGASGSERAKANASDRAQPPHQRQAAKE